ncbi:D-alanyl-D-alanine carboxypeptidase family protein [Streptomyces sp. NPDC006463]|uniref:D-alanyl-D-alanine carboxypeptidase family protein n=1 Tax=Streptomyces sp. NPDC006463 TaxID=3364746 RepID=UPI0036A7F6F3
MDSDAESADSERTAVFRAVKPKPAADSAPGPAEPKAAPAEESADSERTAVFRAVKPAAADSAAAAPKASTFVPLRTDEPGQQPKPKPVEAPAPKAPAPKAPAPKAPAPKGAAPKAPAPASASAPAPAPAPAMDRTERTTQQPLPPKPPLDMLADLTNNPPPPPSPLRTAIRRFKIYFPLVVLLAIILAVVQLVRPLPQPKLVMTAKSSYTFDGSKPDLPWPSEGQAYMAAAGLGTLGQSGEQKPVPIASVTKSMTAYIILRDHPFKKGEQGQMIDVDKTAETEGKKNNSTDNESTLDTVKEGDKISEHDAIAALMIPSANNIARLLARWDSGSQEAFVKKMNDTAKELGMTNTTYTDPSGLDATTVSTAEDQVKLGLKLVEMDALLEITSKPNWVDPSGKSWRNWNGLVPYNDSLGIKTGTTTKAGGNLLFAAQKKVGKTNQLIVGAVLGQHKPPIIDSVLAASKQLMIATQKALDGAPVVKKGDVVGHVDDGLGGRTPVVATADVQAVGWAGLTVDVKLADGGSKIPQTATAGTEIGVLTVGEGASQVKVPVALQSDLVAPGIGSKLTRVG